MGFYDRHIAPRLVSCACSPPPVRKRRRMVVPRAQGRVLEIGIGSGHNLPHYDPELVEMVWGLEPDETMRTLARKRVAQSAVPVEWLGLPGEEIPLEDDSADTVVTTFTLCTIPDLDAALAQMRRVLKPGGALLFLEHGESPDPRLRAWQHRIEPYWKPMAGGCHLTRPIPSLIEDAGFKIDEMETGYIPGLLSTFMKFATYNFWGTAKAR